MFTPILNTETSENHLLHNDIPPTPIADMQSLLGYAATTDPFMNTYPNQLNFLNYAPPPPPLQSQQQQLPPTHTNVNNFSAFPTSPSYKDFVDSATKKHEKNENVQSGKKKKKKKKKKAHKVLDSKVVYLVEDSDKKKSNRGFCSYSNTPTPRSSPGPKRYKQSLNGIKFECKRNKEVHECFASNPDLLALGGYESVMKKVKYRFSADKKPRSESEEAVKLFGGILNKLTPEKFDNLLFSAKSKCKITQYFTFEVVAQTFHSKIILQKPLVRLYVNFLLKASDFIKFEEETLCDMVLQLIWKDIDDQFEKQSMFCRSSKEENDNDNEQLAEEYNNWLEGLYGNYVLLIELYVERRSVFKYEKLHFVLMKLINCNVEWMWNIIYVILIFHGVALQEIETKSLEEYLEAIDDLVEGINYHKSKINPKYAHIPLRIKYLFMDVQEHIETQNGMRTTSNHQNFGFLQPKKLNEIHAEFCRENNMTQMQLRKLLKCKIVHSDNADLTLSSTANTTTTSTVSISPQNEAKQRRFAPQQNEYPWHTPPRFQRMRQQQRLEQEKKKKNKAKKQNKKQQKQQQQHQKQRKVYPLYLNDSSIPSPPKRNPPPPPLPTASSKESKQHETSSPTTASQKRRIRAKRKVQKKVKESNNNNDGWTTVKRANTRIPVILTPEIVQISNKLPPIKVQKKKCPKKVHKKVKKASEKSEKIVKKQAEKQVEKCEKEKIEKVVVKDKEREIKKVSKQSHSHSHNHSHHHHHHRHKKKKKKKKKVKKKKLANAQQQQTTQRDVVKENDDEEIHENISVLTTETAELQSELSENTEETAYDDSDDEIWCESTVSSSSMYNDNGIVPALMFGAETEEQHMEELETALFCEYIDDIDEDGNALCDMDGYTEDYDVYEHDDKEEEEQEEQDKKEEEIRKIIGKYLNDGNEECAFLYFHQHKNEKSDDYKYEFIAVCIKLFLEFGHLDNEKSQNKAKEIERLFCRQMYFNNTLNESDYVNALKLLSHSFYFSKILDGDDSFLQPLTRLFVAMIHEKIICLGLIASTLMDTKCTKTKLICRQIVKHLIHCNQNNVEKMKNLKDEVAKINILDFEQISSEI